jgi:hypothetical protein
LSKQSVEVDIPSSKVSIRTAWISSSLTLILHLLLLRAILQTSEHSSESEDKVHPGWIIETPAREVNNKDGWIEDNVEKKIVPSVDVGSARRPSSASQASVNANMQVSAVSRLYFHVPYQS